MQFNSQQFNQQQEARLQQIDAGAELQPLLCTCSVCEGRDSIFTCDCCGRNVPFCLGQFDEYPDTCDDCWKLISKTKSVN